MKGTRFTQVGIDRLVRLSWLEKVTTLALAGNSTQEIKEILQRELQESFRSRRADVRGSLDKTITILLKVWINTPHELQPLREDGMELLQKCPQENRLAIHWGMVMATYPFWASVATQVGRLLRLQGTAAASHVQRRVREQYGERETVSRRVRYVVRSFLDWRVLNETRATGVYGPGTHLSLDDASLAAWLVEAALHSQEDASAPLSDLLMSPRLFPFKFSGIRVEHIVGTSSRIDIVRHGLDEKLVVLCRPR